MSRIREYRPIEFRQVCAIARLVLLRTPSMTDAEWKAETKEAAAKQGYDEPPADMLARALGAVEQAVKQTIGPRQIVELAPAQTPAKVEQAPLTERDWRAFADTLKAVIARSAAVAQSNVTGMPRQTLDISEHAALDQFYIEAQAGDRVAALRRFAEIAIAREAGWNTAAVRAESGRHSLRASECFACRADHREIAWHHVIQVQHGGSNLLRNRVALCSACHADVHPWLPKAARVVAGSWYHLGILAPGARQLVADSRAKHHEQEVS